jgi:EF hand
MFFLAGSAATSALDLISKLQQSFAGRAAGAQTSSDTQAATASPFNLSAPSDTSGASGATATSGTQIAPGTMSALLSAQGQQTPLVNGDAFSQKLFSLLDTNSDGSISKNEFETAFGQNGNTTLADSIFAKLDGNGDGSVSPTELTNALDGADQSQGMQQAHHHRHHGGFDMSGMGQSSATNASGGGSTDPLMQLGNSQTATNADGSITTTISYADGSQVSMTAPGSNGSGTGASPNLVERMIQHQAQMLASATAGQSLTMNV